MVIDVCYLKLKIYFLIFLINPQKVNILNAFYSCTNKVIEDCLSS